MEYNIVTATFDESHFAITPVLYRYNYGNILAFEGIENLPEYFEVHFANKGDETTRTQLGHNGQVEIPNEYLETGKQIVAYIYLHETAADGETVYKTIIPVRDREEPEDVQPTPEQQTALEAAIYALNTETGVATEAAESAEESANAASDSATVANNAASSASESATRAQNIVDGAIDDINDAKAAAVQAVRTEGEAQTANAKEQAERADASATAAASSASQAETSATNAGNSATAAAQSATAALNAKAAAEQARTAAAQSATNAATAENNASTKAGEAAQSAASAASSVATATQKASEASASATAAAGSATNAGSAANAAAASATAAGNAQTAAEIAQDKAKDAQEAAETAQNAAETAAASVAGSASQIAQNTEDIVDLKSALDELVISIDAEDGIVSPSFDWTSGKYVNNSNNAISNGSAQLYLSDFIGIPFGTSKIITNPNKVGIAWSVAFYDNNKEFISGIMNADYMAGMEITEIPINAKYLLVTNYDTGSYTHDKVYVHFVSFERLAKMEDDISDLSSNLVLDTSYINVLNGASSFQDNKFVNNAGNVVNNPNFCLIDGYFPVKPGTTYKLYRGEPSLYSNAGHNWTWWDENKTFISYQLSGSAVTSPENAAYLRFGVSISNTGSATHEDFDPTNVVITEDAKPSFDDDFTNSFVCRPTFKGLKWIGIGDSITEANFRATYHYWDYIMAETGLNFVNMGVSGTGYKAEGSGDKAFYKRVPSMATDADVITIFGGVNDVVLSNADIGAETDTGTTTICGCVNTTLDAIETLYPAHMPIGIISPLPCYCSDTTVNIHPYQQPNDDTCRMAQFVEQLALICKHRGIPFLDLFHQSNLRPWHQECNAKYFSCDSAKTGDGLHPNGHGHRLFYRQIMDFVQKIVMQ